MAQFEEENESFIVLEFKNGQFHSVCDYADIVNAHQLMNGHDLGLIIDAGIRFPDPVT